MIFWVSSMIYKFSLIFPFIFFQLHFLLLPHLHRVWITYSPPKSKPSAPLSAKYAMTSAFGALPFSIHLPGFSPFCKLSLVITSFGRSHRSFPHTNFSWVSYCSSLPNPPFFFLFLILHACVHASCFNHVWLFATLCTVALQAPLSMGFSSKNTGVNGHVLLQGIFPTQGSNPCLYVSCTGRR